MLRLEEYYCHKLGGETSATNPSSPLLHKATSPTPKKKNNTFFFFVDIKDISKYI